MTPRSISYSSAEHSEYRKQICEALLALDALGVDIVFVDEFKVSHYTHAAYNWTKSGTYPGLPLAGFQRSFSCIAAVTKDSLLKISLAQTNNNSRTFCEFMVELLGEIRAAKKLDSRRLVFFMDGAKIHTSRMTAEVL